MIFAAFQSAIAIFSVFGTYRMVISSVGVEVFGLWSILISGAALAKAADVSGGSGLARFVAECEAGRWPKIGAVSFVHTTLLFNVVLMLTVSVALLVVSPLIITYLYPERSSEIVDLIPIVIISSVILPPISALLCATLDGLKRVGLRALIMSSSYGVLFGSTWLMIDPLGIYGFAVAVSLQHLYVIAASWLAARRYLPEFGWFPLRGSKEAFRESYRFGLSIQATSLAGIMSDPLARVIIAWSGGLQSAAYYELAVKLLQQLRGVLVAAMQPMVAQIASYPNESLDGTALIEKLVRMASIAGVIYACGVSAILPTYANVMLDGHTNQVVIYGTILSGGYGINMISVPMFFSGLARGVMRWNLRAQVCMAVSILLIGTSSSYYIGSNGVLIAQFLGLLLGSSMIVFGNAKALNMFDNIINARLHISLSIVVILLSSMIGYLVNV